MKRFFIFVSMIVVLLCSAEAFAANKVNGNIKVEVGVIATDIEERAPVGVGDKFSHDVEKLFCYTKITGLDEKDVVEHVWYWNDKEMARVDLNVSPPAWRIWSSKRIVRVWKGQWRVDVLAHGKVLKSLEFTVNKAHDE
jgi:hypothetical protein